MRIVVVSPSVQRFDATTHYRQAEFAACVAYLRTRFPHAQVIAEPAGLIGAPWRIIVRHPLDRPEYVMLWARVWESPAAREIAQLVREISPATRLLVWGDGPLFMPQFFTREPFDAAVINGDAELVLADAIEQFEAGQLPARGLVLKVGPDRWERTAPGNLLDPADWPFPADDVIPFTDYHQARELRGKPTDDLSFDVSRGCPVGCAWCIDPLKGGQIVGSTDRLGERPNSRPLVPANIHATIYQVLGLDPKLQLLEPSGRPVSVLDDPTPIHELL